MASSEAEDINTILDNCLLLEKQREPAWIPRIKVRRTIIKAWDIKPSSGARIIDIGCGQGESSVSLAYFLGPDSLIHGIDDALPDYGTPYTVSQSWDHISRKTMLGKRIRFHNTDTADFVQSVGTTEVLDGAILCQSLWYFPNIESVIELFKTLSQARIPRVYVSEYAFEASSIDQEAHFLAAKSQALFHSFKTPRPAGKFTLNIRAAPSVKLIKEACAKAGYSVVREGRITPGEDLLEGHRQATYTRSNAYIDRVKAEGFAQDKEEEILAYVPLIGQAYKKMGKEKARAMDIWWAEMQL